MHVTISANFFNHLCQYNAWACPALPRPGCLICLEGRPHHPVRLPWRRSLTARTLPHHRAHRDVRLGPHPRRHVRVVQLERRTFETDPRQLSEVVPRWRAGRPRQNCRRRRASSARMSIAIAPAAMKNPNASPRRARRTGQAGDHPRAGVRWRAGSGQVATPDTAAVLGLPPLTRDLPIGWSRITDGVGGRDSSALGPPNSTPELCDRLGTALMLSSGIRE
jgi:hypothetical protein